MARRRRLRWLVPVATIILLASACSDDDGSGGESGSTSSKGTSGTTTTTTLPPAEPSSFEEADCWWDEPATMPAEISITCGTVEVPSVPGDTDSDPVTLAVARVHHQAADPDEPPVLLLHGGPGGDALSAAPEGLFGFPALEERDFILYDQRGAGRSTPSLNCPEKEEAILQVLSTADDWESEYEINRDAVKKCFERLTDDGIDLDQYDTLASVNDMEVLRETFGFDEWNVLGGSYGSRLGLAYAREHPDRVRSLVIDSVYPPEVGGVERAQNLPGDALQRLFDACADDDACSTAYGDLGEALDKAVADFDSRPETLTREVKLDGTTEERDFAITGADVRGGMFSALYQSDLIPSLPSIITSLSQGDRSIIPAYIDQGMPLLVGLSEGAFYSVECADSGRALEGEEATEALSDVGDDSLVALSSAQVYCQDWPVEFLPESFNEQVTADVPTLVYAGTLDPITPYTDSKAQAEAMPDARYIEVPRGGHGVAGFDDCTQRARTEFWADPSVDPPDCVASIEPLPFSVGG